MASRASLRLLGGCALSVSLTVCSGGPGAAETAPPPVALQEVHPQILAMAISDSTLHVGEWVHGHVDTTADVTAVELHIGFWHMPLDRTGLGHFAASGKIPFIAYFFRGDYTLRVIATSANGKEAERDLPIRLR
jgi:hypothetical protein